MRTIILISLLCYFSCTPKPKEVAKEQEKLPNIIYILADDMGYGDVSANNPESKVATPNIDRLAGEGMRFTDAHSPSSVCTPTRYGILTGRYCWRTRLPQGVLQGYGQALIEQQETTVAELLKRHGYTTGVVGKWHLGLDWAVKSEYKDSLQALADVPILRDMNTEWVDFNTPPANGPKTHGFDYSYILPASLDMEPYCYLENDVLETIPDEYTPGNALNSGDYATGAFWRAGRIAKGFDFYEVLPTFIQKATQFVTNHAKDEKPFFLYLPLAAPHSPWVPKENYKGKSGAGEYGDFVQMVDAKVGEFLKAVENSGISDNTLIIFTSDNGPFWKPHYIEKYNHRSAYIYRGMKGDAWDGGHRIPFIVKWPGKVAANSQSSQLTSLTNLFSTVAEVVKDTPTKGEGMDSESILPVLFGAEADNSNVVIHHSSKAKFAIRTGDWKLIEVLGSGGFTVPAIIEPEPGEPIGQLYDLKSDPGEQTNLYAQQPEKVAELTKQLNAIRKKNF